MRENFQFEAVFVRWCPKAIADSLQKSSPGFLPWEAEGEGVEGDRLEREGGLLIKKWKVQLRLETGFTQAT